MTTVQTGLIADVLSALVCGRCQIAGDPRGICTRRPRIICAAGYRKRHLECPRSSSHAYDGSNGSTVIMHVPHYAPMRKYLGLAAYTTLLNHRMAEIQE